MLQQSIPTFGEGGTEWARNVSCFVRDVIKRDPSGGGTAYIRVEDRLALPALNSLQKGFVKYAPGGAILMASSHYYKGHFSPIFYFSILNQVVFRLISRSDTYPMLAFDTLVKLGPTPNVDICVHPWA